MGELIEEFVQHVFDLRGFHAGGRDFTAMLRAPKGSASNPLMQFVGDFGEDGLLRGGEFEHQRHEQALAFDSLRGALLQNFFEEHALVGDVLVDDPESFFIDGQDE